jgi:hypothetical protein
MNSGNLERSIFPDAKTYVITLPSDERTRQLERKAKKKIFFSKVGAAILALGFSFQLLSNFVN